MLLITLNTHFGRQELRLIMGTEKDLKKKGYEKRMKVK